MIDDASERFWIGPENPEQHTVYHAQSESTEVKWLEASDATQLDPDYSEYSVRVHDPQARSLSFINRTIAILPKSRLRTIYNLIGLYLKTFDEPEEQDGDDTPHICVTCHRWDLGMCDTDPGEFCDDWTEEIKC